MILSLPYIIRKEELHLLSWEGYYLLSYNANTAWSSSRHAMQGQISCPGCRPRRRLHCKRHHPGNGTCCLQQSDHKLMQLCLRLYMSCVEDFVINRWTQSCLVCTGVRECGGRAEVASCPCISPPQPPSPVLEESEEGSSPRPSISDNGNLNALELLAVSILYD